MLPFAILGIPKMSTNHLMNNFGTRNLTLVRGRGSWVWDDRGERYLDAISGIAVCGLGHSHPAVTSAIREQAEILVHCSNLFNIEWQQRLADELAAVSGMPRAFFCNSGTEANEAAIKLCRLEGHKRGYAVPHMIACEGSFHGRTLGALSATYGAKVRKGFEPLLEGFSHVPYGDVAAIEAAATSETVAVMLEPIQGEAGIVIPPVGYLDAVRALCDRKGWLLVLDEIQTGNGRTGTYFAFQHSSARPDILTTAKGLGNGLPIGVCLASEATAALFVPGSHGSTFGGNPLVSRAAHAVVKEIERGHWSAAARSRGNTLLAEFKGRLSGLAQIADIRGSGLMMAIEMQQPCGDLVAKAAAQGLIINVTGGNRVRLLPPLNIDDSESEYLLDRLCPIISQWKPTP